MIKYIWTYWENEVNKQLPEYINLCHQSIIETNPNCQFVILTPDILFDHIDPLPVTLDSIYIGSKNEPSLALKADVIRVQVLKKHGGIWIDSDCIALGELDHLFEIIEQKAFFAIEKKTENGVYYANNLIGSAPGGKIITEYADEQIRLIQQKQSKGETYDWIEIGSGMLTGVVKANLTSDYQLLDEILYHPLGFRDHGKFLLNDFNQSVLSDLSKCHTVMLYNSLFPDELKNMTEHQILNAPMLLSSIFRRVFSDSPPQSAVARTPEPRWRVTYEDIALIFTTMRRPKSCRRFVASVRKHLPPEIKIYIAVQGDPLCDYEALQSDPNVHLHSVPDDYGLSASRNYLIDHTSEPVIFLCDDDFLMTGNTRLDIALEIWNENSGIKILGGMFENFYYDENDKVTNKEYTSFDNKIVRHRLLPCSTIFIPSQYIEKDYNYFDDIYYFYYTDSVNNFALMDRAYMEELGLRWDDNLKISGEHEDFYLKLKDRISPANNVVAFTNALFVEHHRHTNQHFKPLRERKEYHIESIQKSSSKTWIFVGKRSEKIFSGTLDSSRHP